MALVASVGIFNTKAYVDTGFLPFALNWGDPNDKRCGKIPVFKGWKLTTKENALTNFIKAVNWKGDVNIGILTGQGANLIVVDVDLADRGVEYYFAEIGPRLHHTQCYPPIVRTGSGGYHLYFNWSQAAAVLVSRAKTQTDTGVVGIDVKSNGSYVVAPPSKHRSGGTYTILSGYINQRLDMPDWLIEFLRAPPKLQPVSLTRQPGNFVSRILETDALMDLLDLLGDYRVDNFEHWRDVCFAIPRVLNHHPDSREVMAVFSQRSNKSSDPGSDRMLDDFLIKSERENGFAFWHIAEMARFDNPNGYKAWCRANPPGASESKIDSKESDEFDEYESDDDAEQNQVVIFDPLCNNDVDWADQMIRVFNGSVVTTEDDKWFANDTTTGVWPRLELEGDILNLITRTAKVYVASLDLDPKDKRPLDVAVSKITFARKIKPLMRPGLVQVGFTRLNKCPQWAPLNDGFKVHLTTFQVERIAKEDYFFMTTRVSAKMLKQLSQRLQTEPDLQRKYASIDNYMNCIAYDGNGQVDPELAVWHIKMAIYLLSGATHWDIFFNLYGRGSNGKTTFIQTIAAILGPMAQPISDDALHASTRQSGSAHTEHLVALEGARVTYQDETTDGPLNEHLIKSISGGDPISARGCHGKQIKDGLRLCTKLILGTNELLTLTEGPQTARRVRGENFRCSFVKTPQQPTDVQMVSMFRTWLQTQEGYSLFFYYLLTKSAELNWDLMGEEPAIPAVVASFSQLMQSNSAKAILAGNFREFVETCMIVDPNARSTSTEILRLYESWAKPKGYCTADAVKIGKMLLQQGIGRNEISGVSRYHLRPRE